MKMHELLKMVVDRQSSDLHVVAGAPPVIRVHGELVYAGLEGLSSDETRGLLYEVMTDEQKRKFEAEKEIDFSYSLDEQNRFRVNIYWQRGTVAGAFRLISSAILSFEKLGLPPIINKLTQKPRGLILVTGATGSGKSTTLAAMIDALNKERSCHIITLEDPIEYIHNHQRSIISQREIGTDTVSFARALRECLRQDPDVILIGEMRDLETISTAITAAETGHLVLATLHTTDAVQTIDRIIDVFPPYQQSQVRTQLAITMQAVVSQQLLIKADGKGRVPAVEILVVTPAVRNLIREGKTYQIYSNIETGREYGMQTLEQALEALLKKKLISYEEAVLVSREPEDFKKKVSADGKRQDKEE